MPQPQRPKKTLAFDLETIADPACLPILPEVKPKTTLKDPAKIEADIAEKKKKQLLEMGLSPLTNIICCAGYFDGETAGHIMLQDEASEKDLLEELWELLSGYDHFITFNGRSYDLRCLYLHSMQHGVRASVNIDKGRYNKTGANHTDMRLVLAGDDKFAPGKLDFFARKFLGDHKTEGIDGALVQHYWDCGMKEEIGVYVEQDCRLPFQLYQMAERSGLLE